MKMLLLACSAACDASPELVVGGGRAGSRPPGHHQLRAMQQLAHGVI